LEASLPFVSVNFITDSSVPVSFFFPKDDLILETIAFILILVVVSKNFLAVRGLNAILGFVDVCVVIFVVYSGESTTDSSSSVKTSIPATGPLWRSFRG
jgi:hypothetical protein